MACRRLSLTVCWALEVGSRAGSRLRPYVLPFEPEAIRAPQTWLVATPSSSQCGIIVLAAELCDFLDFWLDGSCPPYPPTKCCSRIRGGCQPSLLALRGEEECCWEKKACGVSGIQPAEGRPQELRHSLKRRGPGSGRVQLQRPRHPRPQRLRGAA